MDVLFMGKASSILFLISPRMNAYQQILICMKAEKYNVLKIKITSVQFLYHKYKIRQCVCHQSQKLTISSCFCRFICVQGVNSRFSCQFLHHADRRKLLKLVGDPKNTYHKSALYVPLPFEVR